MGKDPRFARVRLGLVLTMVFWGSAFPASKIIVLHVRPEVGAVLRFGLGALLMGAILFRRAAQPVPPRAAWGGIAVVGLVGVALFNTAFFRGLSLAPASDAAVIIPTLSPVLTAAAGILLLGEPVSARRVTGLGTSLAGSVLFFWGVVAHAQGPGTRILGDLFLLGAAAMWAAYSIVSRSVLAKIGALPATAWSMLLGSAVLLLIALPRLAAVPWAALPARFWLVLAYLVVCPTVIAYLLWMEGIRVIGPGPATSFMFLAPVSGLVLSALLLGDRPTPAQGAGGALMLLGVWWMNRP